MEHRQADVRQVAGFGASGDDAARFLRELRQLRDSAGLGHAELAARAHFPYDSIRAAEVGPSLPDLPVLCAFVRGCGGTSEEWEERWRSLTRSPSLPVPASRTAGRSDAATAGARIGSVTQVGDSPDPSIIIAALSRVAEEMASPVPADAAPPAAAEPAAADKATGWDPIRVSTAWPVLRDTSKVDAEPGLKGAASTTGSAAPWEALPWEAAPWAKDAPDADVSAAGTVDAAVTGGGAAPDATRAPAPVAPAPVVPAPSVPTASVPTRAMPVHAGPAPAVGAGAGSVRASSRTRLLVIAAVLLCVIAVLLAVFA